jgi:hypothetical protein
MVGAMGRDGIPATADVWRALWLSRLVVWLSGAGAVLVWGLASRARAFDPAGYTRPFAHAGDVLAAPAARWDSAWYLLIAHDGYRRETARSAFFPLYPALVRAAGFVTGSALVGGVLVSLAAFAVALVLLHRLTELELGRDAARATVLVTAFFPMAFFHTAVYSEAVFLAFSVGAFYAARSGRWAWAGALGALGAMTRSAGVLLVVPLALLYLHDHQRRVRDVLWIALVPLGLASFCLWLAATGSDGLAPFRAQEVWFRHFAGPFGGVGDGAVAAWDGARQLLSGSRDHVYFTRAAGDPFAIAGHNLVLFAFLLAGVPALIGVLRRLPLAYGAYVLAAFALALSYPVTPQPLMSLPRFEAVLFPLFMWLGWWTSRGGPWRERIVLSVSAAGLAVFSAQFATWHWVA